MTVLQDGGWSSHHLTVKGSKVLLRSPMTVKGWRVLLRSPRTVLRAGGCRSGHLWFVCVKGWRMLLGSPATVILRAGGCSSGHPWLCFSWLVEVCQMHEKDLRHWSFYFEDVIVLHAFLLFCPHCCCCISFFFTWTFNMWSDPSFLLTNTSPLHSCFYENVYLQQLFCDGKLFSWKFTEYWN